MSKTNLVAVLQKLIKEGPESAQEDLHKYFVETCVEINESLHEESDSTEETSHDDTACSEESVTEASEDEVVSDETDIDSDDTSGDDVSSVEVDDTTDTDGDESEETDIVTDEDDIDLEDKVEDLEAELASLEAKFLSLVSQDSDTTDSDDTVMVDPDENDDTLVVDNNDDGSESPISGDEEEITFEDSDFSDLEEAYQLEKVKDPNLNGSKEIGSDGQKIAVNDESPVLQKKVGDRIGGEPIEIISDEHSGYEREASPSTKEFSVAKNQQKKATQDLKNVSKEGDKSALINQTTGFGTDNTKSPVIATKSLQK